MSPKYSWIQGMSEVLISPVIEEIIFRGMILKSAKTKWGDFFGIGISSTLFAFYHSSDSQMIAGLLLGFVYAWLYIRSGSIWLGLYLHIIFNLITFLAIKVFPVYVSTFSYKTTIIMIFFFLSVLLTGLIVKKIEN